MEHQKAGLSGLVDQMDQMMAGLTGWAHLMEK